MRLLLTIPLLLMIVSAQPALAIINVKLGYSLLRPDTRSLSRAFLHQGENVDRMRGLTADLLLNIENFPVDLGIRYEYFAKSEKLAGGEAPTFINADFTRISALVSKRTLESKIYIGLVGSVGLVNDLLYRRTAGTYSETFRADTGLTASAGLETGARISEASLGAEVGFLHADLKNLKNPDGFIASIADHTVEADISGPYIKVLAGYEF